MTTSASAHPRTRAAALGLLAAALLEGVARLVAGPLGAASPVRAVADAVVQVSPPALTETAIRWFGTNDKAVLVTTVVVAVAVLAGTAGVLALRRPAAATLLVVLLGLVGVLAAVTAPAGGPLAAVPTVVGVAVALPVLLWSVRRSARPAPAGDPGGRAPSRRSFLGLAAGVAVAAAATAAAGRALARTARDAVASRAALVLPRPVSAAAPLPDGAEVSPLTPFRTPNADFYRIDTALAVPQLPAEQWSLRIHGQVAREVRLDWSGLLERESVERWVTLVCVSNEVGGRLAGTAVWSGTPLGALLDEAGPMPGADMVLSTSVDGFTASTPLAALTTGDALLAYGMNGEPLPLEHGFPVRMVVPGLYGYVSATKWVVDLEVTSFSQRTAFWTTRGYAAQAPVKVASRIDVPRPFARPAAGPVTVAGVAWAPGTGIDLVEVRVDGGAWAPADLAPVPGPATWRQWSWQWDAAPGMHTLEVRATDADGRTQTADRAAIKPDGATGWHSVVVQVT